MFPLPHLKTHFLGQILLFSLGRGDYLLLLFRYKILFTLLFFFFLFPGFKKFYYGAFLVFILNRGWFYRSLKIKQYSNDPHILDYLFKSFY